MGNSAARRNTAHVTPKVNWCMHTMFKSVNPSVSMAKVLFCGFFRLDMDRNGCGHIHIV